MDINEQLQASQKECESLRRENEQLKHALAEREKQLKLERTRQRISLFKHLFKGRSDIFPVRWVASDGRTGYSPAKNAQEQYLTLNDQVIYDHLSGKHTIGIYPVLTDDTCFFLSIDFDKEHWQKDALAFVDTCETRCCSFI
ncbi:TOTE conflict system archaeo-eukaryotic primase domain-containing protein [Salicibibacter kimchii]|uniref:TOTE conflict system primase domain-containing protein n=1 Tax=Salicibibacter kimchii TaxID=2099786 RepID=A0A345BYJ3_9BACI|nr:hypothetical protein [Salicibibacter kimchii]AXF56024.1 hypothetical protein DT065_08290 [Salicibibacter kimchii]